jgi:hypothetical protein
LVTVFLDVPAATAYARKDDHYLLPQLERQARLYRAEFSQHRAHRLDGERPAADLCAEISTLVVQKLRSR